MIYSAGSFQDDPADFKDPEPTWLSDTTLATRLNNRTAARGEDGDGTKMSEVKLKRETNVLDVVEVENRSVRRTQNRIFHVHSPIITLTKVTWM